MLIIEFLGMPASGKTTLANAILQQTSLQSLYFSSDAISSLPEDTPYSFNHRFLIHLSTLLGHLHTLKADVLILDRGVHDTRIWLSVHRNTGNITLSEFEALSQMIPSVTHAYQFEPFLFLQSPDVSVSRKRSATRRQDEWAFTSTFLKTLYEEYKNYAESLKEDLHIIPSGEELSQVKSQVFHVLYRKTPLFGGNEVRRPC